MKKTVTFFVAILILILVPTMLYIFNIIPHKEKTNGDFNIKPYISKIDKDNDGIDDQTDILQSTREYIKTNPKYKSKYYANGYPDDQYGVCTDVVGFGLLGAGYDLMDLVNKDVIKNRENYDIDTIDKNIDFRRVKNLKVYFDNNAHSLTTDIHKIDEWQGGDIVVFENHIGIVSDKRNKDGVTFVIHNASPAQKSYEQDILEYRNDIVGHYRIS
ncbi:MAG: DUF1287 domain-containing protein [Oscillospiraceae bacterium]